MEKSDGCGSIETSVYSTEIGRIVTAIRDLEQEMQKYVDHVKYIWTYRIKPFLLSDDCTTFQYMGDQDYNKFLKFMLNQRTYKIMCISMKRLNQRLNYLQSVSNVKHSADIDSDTYQSDESMDEY